MSRARPWAIITGASSGIGRALAREFAAGGFNVLLTGRNQVGLATLAEECAHQFRVQTEVVPADLARGDALDGLLGAISRTPREVGVLVNNAGFGVQGPFVRTALAQEIDLINVQLAAALTLTKAVLPGMIERGYGRILNVGSVYCYVPVPFQAVYAAGKAFLLSFSASLRNELAVTGVTVTVFCPGATQTEFRTRAGIAEKNRHAGLTAEAAAHIAYVTTMRGQAVVIPGIANRLFVGLATLLPSRLVTRAVRAINRRRGHHPS
jgi:uncharacterized protein